MELIGNSRFSYDKITQVNNEKYTTKSTKRRKKVKKDYTKQVPKIIQQSRLRINNKKKKNRPKPYKDNPEKDTITQSETLTITKDKQSPLVKPQDETTKENSPDYHSIIFESTANEPSNSENI